MVKLDSHKFLGLLFISLGIFLAILQFGLNRSLWLDEAMLGINYTHRSFLELLGPLDYMQVAPIGFLWIEKFLFLVLGQNDLALRVFPLVCFLTAIPIVFLFTEKLTENKSIAWLGTACFSLAIIPISYSSEAKQYICDVLIGVGILYLTLFLDLKNSKQAILFGCTGTLSIFVSNISVMFLFLSALYLLTRKDNYTRNLILIFLLWGITFSLYWLAFIHNNAATAMMKEYWNDAFLPANPFKKDFYLFLYFSAQKIFTLLLGLGEFWKPLTLFCSLTFLLLIFQRKFKVVFFLLGPLAIHLALSALKLYPFTGRFLLYSIPFLLIFMSIGIFHLYHFIAIRIQPRFPVKIHSLLFLPVLMLFFPIWKSYPIQKEEIKKCLTFIHSQKENQVPIFVYYSARPAFDFYQVTGKNKLPNPVLYNEEHRDSLNQYGPQLLSLKGKNWFLFSHVYPFGKSENEETYMIHFLTLRGAKLLAIQKFVGCSLYLLKIN